MREIFTLCTSVNDSLRKPLKNYSEIMGETDHLSISNVVDLI